jgi:4-amino-4-deoxychorismate lyase
MSLLVETIKIHNGCFVNADVHQRRMNHARKVLYGAHEPFNLIGFLDDLQIPNEGLFKCRLIYDHKILDIHINPYEVRKIEVLKLVCHDNIAYPFKMLDRLLLDELFQQKGIADEILVVKHGMITDAYYYNVVFQKDNLYFTPANPLLKGVQREVLLKNREISTKEIKDKDIYKYDFIHLINAMTSLHEIKISTSQIIK